MYLTSEDYLNIGFYGTLGLILLVSMFAVIAYFQFKKWITIRTTILNYLLGVLMRLHMYFVVPRKDNDSYHREL